MGMRYTNEKFSLAAYDLAIGTESLQDRLFGVWTDHLHKLSRSSDAENSEVPERFAPEYELLASRLQGAQSLSDEDAVQLAVDLMSLYHSIEQVWEVSEHDEA